MNNSSGGDNSNEVVAGMRQLFCHRLPMNRKERYFTGTVLPMIIACDGFKYLGRFFDLCDAPDVTIDNDPESTNLQFFSEYGFKESLFNGAENRFGIPEGRDTPDLVLYVEGKQSVLLSVEAKVYDRPPIKKLHQQLHRQQKLLGVMAEGLTNPTIHQVALLPAGFLTPTHIGNVPVVTWEAVADAYRDVAPPYWIGVLDEALRNYDSLVSKSTSGGANNDSRLSGQEIMDRWKSKDQEFTWMGRNGGLSGEYLQRDRAENTWRSQPYEVRHEPLENNKNWFPIKSFIEMVPEQPSKGNS